MTNNNHITPIFDTEEGFQALLDAPILSGPSFGAGRGVLRDLAVTRFPDVVGAGEAARGSAYITQMQHRTFVGKHFVRADNERGWKTANPGNFYDGTAVVHSVPTSADLQALIGGLGTNDALTIGRPSNGAMQARVVTKYQAQLAQDAGKLDVISRSKDHFHFPTGVAGWLLLDVDPKSMPPAARAIVESNGGLLESIFSIWPDLRGYDYLAVPSSSAGVAADGRMPDSLYAMHVYVLVPDLSKALAITNNLLARCWGMGLAWWMISASGSRLERGLIDVSVASPERLAFEAAPVLDDGLVRHALPTTAHSGNVAQLPQPPSRDRWREKRADAWHAAEGAAQAAKLAHRAAYIAKAVAELGVSEETAGAMYDRTLGGKALGDGFLLPWNDGGYRRVGDVLDYLEAQRAADGKCDPITLPDPLEGHDYHHAAQLRWGAGYASPVIHSRAHGQDATFVFERYIAPPVPPDTSGDGPAPTVTDKRSPEWQAARRAKVDEATAHLRFIATKWLASAVTEGAVLMDVAAADARADARLEVLELAAGGFDDPDDAQRLQARLRREERKAVKDKHNLPEIPNSAFKQAAGGYIEGHGTIAENVVITGAQGIGKTSIFHGNDTDDTRPAQSGLAHTVIGANVFYAQPDTDKAEESFHLYQRNATEVSPVAIHLRGRDSDDPENPGSQMCLEPELAQTVQSLGESTRAACNVCPSRDLCGYMKQPQKVEDAKAKGRGLAVFGDSNYLHIGLPVDIPLTRIVADEMQRGLGVETLEAPIQRLTDIKFPEPQRRAGETEDSYMQRFNAASAEWQVKVAIVLDRLKAALVGSQDTRQPSAWILEAIEKQGLTVTALLECASVVAQRPRNTKMTDAILEATKKARSSGSGSISGDVSAALSSMSPTYPHAAVAALLRDLAKELAARQAAADAGLTPKSTMAAVRWADARKRVLKLTTRKPLAYKGVPMMHLDGTGSSAVSSMVFDREFGEESVAAPRNAIFTLVTGRGFSQRALLPPGVAADKTPTAEQMRKDRDAQRLRSSIIEVTARWAASAGADPSKVVTLTSKKMREAVEADGADFCGPSAHYAKLRGNDSFKGCEAAVLVGNPLPPAESIDGTAVAFSTGRMTDFAPTADGYVSAQHTVAALDGAAATIKEYAMADPLAQLVFGQVFHAEMMQAIDRPRLMFCPEPKPVMLMTGVLPVGVEIDHIVDWTDLKDAGMYEIKYLKNIGFVPLSPSALARFSGIFKTGDLGEKNIYSPKSPVLGLPELTQDQARTVTPRAKALTDLIGMPQQIAAKGLPAFSTWFSLSIRLDVPEGEGRFKTFTALGVAGSAEEMRAKVHAAFEGTGYKVRELTIAEQHRDPSTVVITNQPAVLPDMSFCGEASETAMDRALLPDRYKDAQRLTTKEWVNVRTVMGTSDPRRHMVFLVDHDFCGADGGIVDRLSVAFVTDPHDNELMARRTIVLHDDLTVYRDDLPAPNTYAETTTTKTFLGAFATLEEAATAARNWESSVDAIDGEIVSDKLAANLYRRTLQTEPHREAAPEPPEAPKTPSDASWVIAPHEIVKIAAQAGAEAAAGVLGGAPRHLSPEYIAHVTGNTMDEIEVLQARWGLSLEDIDRMDIERREEHEWQIVERHRALTRCHGFSESNQ